MRSTLKVLRLGILFSTVGVTAALGRDCRDGALLAIEDLRAEHGAALHLEPILADPEGSGDGYIALARRMVADDGCRHIVGTVTSQVRKDMIPVVDKHDAQLWYVCPYEGRLAELVDDQRAVLPPRRLQVRHHRDRTLAGEVIDDEAIYVKK